MKNVHRRKAAIHNQASATINISEISSGINENAVKRPEINKMHQ